MNRRSWEWKDIRISTGKLSWLVLADILKKCSLFIQSNGVGHQEQWVAATMNVLGHYLSDTFVSVNSQVHDVSIFSSVHFCKEESRLESFIDLWWNWVNEHIVIGSAFVSSFSPFSRTASENIQLNPIERLWESLTEFEIFQFFQCKARVDTKNWALVGFQGANSDSVSIKWFDTGTTCRHVQAFSHDFIVASYII